MTYATGGGTPWGALIGSHATGVNPANHLYGVQIEVGHEAAPIVSSKALSIWSSKLAGPVGSAATSAGGPITYGAIIWGEGGFGEGVRVTNFSDRNAAESPPFGSIGKGFTVEGSNWLYAGFTGSGSTPIVVGDVITGATSGKTATITAVKPGSVTWPGNAGYFWTYTASGAFTPGETITVGGTTRGTITTNFAPIGSISKGFVATNIADHAFQVTDAFGVNIYSVSGKGVIARRVNAVAAGVASIDASLGDVIELLTSTLGTGVIDITNPALYQEITIIGGGGASPTTIQHASGTGSTNINLTGGAVWPGLFGHVIKLIWNGQWREVSRN